MGKEYNWGILGPGKIGHRWADGLKLLSNARLHAVGSRDIRRAKDFALTHGFKNAYGSYEELVKDPDLDLVYVASPHSHHMEHTLLCLENGKSVICEKAFAINGREVRRMIEMAKQKKLFLMEALWPPFQPSYHFADEVLKSGQLGRIVTLRSFFAFRPPYEPEKRLYNPALGGGTLLDIGIYPVIDALRFLGLPDRIEASAGFADTGVDNTIDMLFVYKDGLTASLFASVKTETGVGTDIICENGVIKLRRLSDGSQLTTIERPGGETTEKVFNPEARGFQFEADEVMSCMDAGLLESRVVPLDFSIKLIDTMDKVRSICGIRYADHD